MIDHVKAKAVHERFMQAASDAIRDSVFVRDQTVQDAHDKTLQEISSEIREVKLAAIEANDDKSANFLLGIQAITDGIVDELAMVRNLKAGRPHDAWRSLVEAQANIALALRTPAAGPNLREYQQRLVAAEFALFPQLTFVSAGWVHRGGVCSICRAEFMACEHIEGEIYCGRVCAERDYTEVHLDHASIVTEPRDRRCYVHTIDDEAGCTIDLMTRVPVSGTFQKPAEPTEGRKSEATIFINQLPPGVEP